jgi:hypothetical protein
MIEINDKRGGGGEAVGGLQLHVCVCVCACKVCALIKVGVSPNSQGGLINFRLYLPWLKLC